MARLQSRSCPECRTSMLLVSVPDEYRDYAPDEASAVAFCPQCLTLEAIAVPGGDEANADADADEYEYDPDLDLDPDFRRVSDAFPTEPERSIPLALALGLCSSLATNRSAIESLLRAVERAGTDPLLVIDRLIADPGVEPAIDLERRQHQLEQLLY